MLLKQNIAPISELSFEVNLRKTQGRYGFMKQNLEHSASSIQT